MVKMIKEVQGKGRKALLEVLYPQFTANCEREQFFLGHKGDYISLAKEVAPNASSKEAQAIANAIEEFLLHDEAEEALCGLGISRDWWSILAPILADECSLEELQVLTSKELMEIVSSEPALAEALEESPDLDLWDVLVA